MSHQHPANIEHHDRAGFGDRAADRVASIMGSWGFIGFQTLLVITWIAGNAFLLTRPFDPYPFILLNLAFSTQAAYAAPILQLASNRQSTHDRLRAEHDYIVNERALDGIRRIAEHIGVEVDAIAEKVGADG